MSNAETLRSDDDELPPPPEVVQMEVGLLQNFCLLLFCPDTREAAVVDPAWEVDRLLREAERQGVRITKALITHGHNDHVEGVAELVARTGATIVVSARELPQVRQILKVDVKADAPPSAAMQEPTAQVQWQTIVDRELVSIGRRGLRALETPGHTIGGTCFLADGYVVTGDVLFVGGCGRTDFPGGDTAAMWKSLQRLAALPDLASELVRFARDRL